MSLPPRGGKAHSRVGPPGGILAMGEGSLYNTGIRLHKFVSNDRDIMLSFPLHELAKDLQSVDLRDSSRTLPMKSSLGIDWDLNSDSFVFTF